jgi:hypothetical protein
VSATLSYASAAIVLLLAEHADDEAQKLPNPCVGNTAVSAGSRSASRRTDRYCARVSRSVCSAPDRSVRPTVPYRRLPPLNSTGA